jgi:hypothetical protein
MESQPTLKSFIEGIHSKEQVLQFVTQKIIEQGKPSYSHISRMCYYRDDHGCRCAIGHLIPDDEYNKNIKGQYNDIGESVNSMGVYEYLKTFYSYAVAISPKGEFLKQLQNTHDHLAVYYEYNFIPKFQQRMASLKEKLG